MITPKEEETSSNTSLIKDLIVLQPNLGVDKPQIRERTQNAHVTRK